MRTKAGNGRSNNQPWSGEANVHVSIANWIKSQDAAVVPKVKRMWTKVEATKGGKRVVKKGFRVDKTYELKDRDCAEISAALSDETHVGDAAQLASTKEPKRVFQGVTPGHDGFVLSPEERQALIDEDPKSAEVIHPYLTGRELVQGDGTPDRFIIDFQRRDAMAIRQFKSALSRVETLVLPDRKRKAEEGRDADGKVRPHHRGFARWSCPGSTP